MKKYFVSVIVIVGLLLSGCGPGTSEGYYCPTMDEFVDRFGEKFAIPTYFPSGFAPDDTGVMFQGVGTFTKEAFHRQGRDGYKNYKEFDIYSSISIRMTLEADMTVTYDVGSVGVSRPMEETALDRQQEFQDIIDNQYGAKIRETVGYPVEDLKKEHWLYTDISIPFKGTNYEFNFTTHIAAIPEESLYTAVRDEMHHYCIAEALKMYESL